MIFLAIFLFVDVCLYISTPYEVRLKQPFLYRMVPGSGFYFFIKDRFK